MFFESFAVTTSAVLQIGLLAGLGYFLVKRQFLGGPCLVMLSNMAIDVCLPALIFYQLLTRFSSQAYPQWWTLPLISFAITLAGVAVGALCALAVKGKEEKRQCISLVAFQNSGYLPLALIASLASRVQSDVLLIYLFLFLAGFNFAMFSLGVYLLTRSAKTRLDIGNFLNPPVIATLAGVAIALLGFSSAIPGVVMKPIHLVGECTLPLAMMVVGGSLAEIKITQMRLRTVFWSVVGKMVLLPALGVAAVIALRLPEALGLTIVLQLAMPSAISLSSIIKKYEQPDLAISHGIFVSHLVSILLIPIFLSLYFSFAVLQ